MSRVNRKRSESKDILAIFYTRRGSSLYGCIQFFKPDPKSQHTKPFHQSAPFVISDSIGPNETVVYGSVNDLVNEIQRLLRDIDEYVDGLSSAFGNNDDVQVPGVVGKRALLFPVPDGEKERQIYFDYKRRITNTLLLISSQTRNLFQTFPRFNKRCISLFDINENRINSIALTDIFNQFVHNRYLFLDGEYVSDLFSDKPPPRAPISKTFMGYKINWIEYINAIGSAIRDVKLKDLTGLLRGRLKKLSLNSPHKDIIFLVQNLESFSGLFAAKIPDGRYVSIVDLLFSELSTGYLDDIQPKIKKDEQYRIHTLFNAPRIGIHEDLGKKEFKVNVRYRWTLRDNQGRLIHEEQELNHTIEVGYERFLDLVDSIFGDDSLLDFRA